jgi:DDE domain
MRGVTLSYETVREWCFKFGQTYANGVRRKSPRPGDRWHLDEVFLRINGRVHYLWRAVDQDGDALDILVQRRRDRKAAKKFFRKLLKGLRDVSRFSRNLGFKPRHSISQTLSWIHPTRFRPTEGDPASSLADLRFAKSPRPTACFPRQAFPCS